MKPLSSRSENEPLGPDDEYGECGVLNPGWSEVSGVAMPCDFAGHEWAPAGGGLLICTICEAEKWEREVPDA